MVMAILWCLLRGLHPAWPGTGWRGWRGEKGEAGGRREAEGKGGGRGGSQAQLEPGPTQSSPPEGQRGLWWKQLLPLPLLFFK